MRLCCTVGCACIALWEKGRRLEFPVWLIAFDRYALGAQAVDHQLSTKEALLHKDVVINVACSAYASGRTDWLGCLYDEVARPVGSRPRLCCLRCGLSIGKMGRLVGETRQQL